MLATAQNVEKYINKIIVYLLDLWGIVDLQSVTEIKSTYYVCSIKHDTIIQLEIDTTKSTKILD